MPRNYLQHGIRHGSQGSDPITNLTATASLTGVVGAPLAVANLTGTRVPWLNFSMTAVFGTDNTISPLQDPPYHNTAGDEYVYFAAPGAYIVSAMAVWEAGSFGQSAILNGDGGELFMDDLVSAPGYTPEILTTNADATGIKSVLAPTTHRLVYLASGATGALSLTVEHSGGGNKNLVNAALGIVYLGLADDLTSVY